MAPKPHIYRQRHQVKEDVRVTHHINSSKLRLYPLSIFRERDPKSETELSNASDPFVTGWLYHKPPFKKWVPVRLTAA